MNGWFRRFSVVAVTLYLLLVLVWLVVTLRISPLGVVRAVRARFSRPYARRLGKGDVHHDGGLCYRTTVPGHLVSDRESRSRLVVLEDERPLPAPRSPHTDIRRLGAGRYSHWGGQVFFSASDGTDPAANGRQYRIVEER